MQKQLVAIVADPKTAQHVSTVIARLLNRNVEVHVPGGIRRIASKISDLQAEYVLYSWTGDEQGVLRWLKSHHLDPHALSFAVFAYKGFNLDRAFEVNRTIAWCEEAQPAAYAA